MYPHPFGLGGVARTVGLFIIQGGAVQPTLCGGCLLVIPGEEAELEGEVAAGEAPPIQPNRSGRFSLINLAWMSTPCLRLGRRHVLEVAWDGQAEGELGSFTYLQGVGALLLAGVQGAEEGLLV